MKTRDKYNVVLNVVKELTVTLLTFTCSKSTIETLEKGVKYVQR